MLWMCADMRQNFDHTPVPLAQVVWNTRQPNSYLPSLVQEVLLMQYGGVELARELLEFVSTLRSGTFVNPPHHANPLPAPQAASHPTIAGNDGIDPTGLTQKI